MVSAPIAAVNITDGYLSFQEKFKSNNSFHNSKITTTSAITAFLIVPACHGVSSFTNKKAFQS
jgi:hypothetical protein